MTLLRYVVASCLCAFAAVAVACFVAAVVLDSYDRLRAWWSVRHVDSELSSLTLQDGETA